MSKIDHIAQIQERIATQYRESSNLLGYIAALLSEANGLEQVFCELAEERTIDNSTGFTLDVIGEIVGQPRVLVDSVVIGYFGFVGALGARSFGDENDPGVGGRFRSEGEPTTGDRTLNDEEYRLFIRARIARNHSDGTIPSLIELVKFITGAPEVVITEGASSIRIGVGKKLTDSEKLFLTTGNLLPKPAGVRIEEFYQYIDDDMFAFAGFPGAKGFNAGEFASQI